MNNHSWECLGILPLADSKRIRCIKCGLQLIISITQNEAGSLYMFGDDFGIKEMLSCEEYKMRRALG